MITEQQVIEKMRQMMSKIEQSNGSLQIEYVAAMKAYCELLLEQPATEQYPPGHDSGNRTAKPGSRSDAGPFYGSCPGKRRKRTFLTRFLSKSNQLWE